MKKRFFALTLAVAGLLAAPLAQAAPIKLRLAHSSSEADSQHIALVHFAERVKTRSNGELEVQIFGNSALGNDNTVLSGTRGGTIDMVLVGNPYYTGLMPVLNVLDLPYLFTDAQQAYRVLDGEVGQKLLDQFEQFQLKGLAFWEVGFRSLANNKRAVNKAEDLRGLKIRTTPNPAHIRAFQLLGANPQPMPLSEVYPALESGALDGHENPPIIMLATKMHEVQKHVSLTRHAYTAMPLSMNKAKFDRLSAEHQAILREEAKAAAGFQREYNASNEAKAIEELRSHGVQVVETPDTDSLRAVVQEETRKLYTDKHGDELLKAIEATQ
ncbi:TRAP transporter substrate-binding protein [Paracandidimonas soli]|uniref:Tripartite ATP-independent transporter DctP family solute receptor n=1 Tax=Paracandidimonas soli TaxID=1917182 RepID=A0A4V2VS79_9BURK|nr:TRAP transporter substrate-binding protein [Paracandidimonas soli]TCV01420.1 tripartite ATP-independent transporter DctP family solute receptor [Paracandidimonas soli]